VITHLYHGSTISPDEVLHKGGLKPRGEKDGNWQHSVESRRDAVYLTDIYGGYFAIAAATKLNAKKAYVYEISLERLDKGKLIPDEDFLEQATRGQSGKNLASHKASIEDRTKFYRDRSHTVGNMWKDSLQYLGTIAHLGPVSAVMISRYVELDLEADLNWLQFSLGDPTITLANHRYCSQKYKTINSWLFEKEVKATDWMGLPPGCDDVLGIKDQAAKLQERLDAKEGITVYSGPAHSTLYSFNSHSLQ
jgi:hypothetical protein